MFTEKSVEQGQPSKKYRIALLFAGGPAPAANSVIGACVTAILKNGHECLGIFHGYSKLQEYCAGSNPMREEQDYRVFTDRDIEGLRNCRGIVIGTARANPGKLIQTRGDLTSKKKTEKLQNTYNALVDLKVDALISIGGDDTLRTANLMVLFQRELPITVPRIRVINLPKTIDNDYEGIDFTFGFFTAVDVMAKEVLNLSADAKATAGYYIIESMGRKAGWLAYGTAIAGEASLVLSVEDLKSDTLTTGSYLDLKKLVEYIILLMVTREEKYGKSYGTVVLAEGLGEQLPPQVLTEGPVDEHGHISLGEIELGKTVARLVAQEYEKRYGKSKKVTGVQLGYESRCAAPHAFDVMLGSQLGVGGYKAIVEEQLDGHMVSAGGQFDLSYVPFEEIIHPETLRAKPRFIQSGSDFQKLARTLETKIEKTV